jgi:hypothetical protein
MTTLERLKAWLLDTGNFVHQTKLPDMFDAEFTLRKSFVTTNGITLSIQMSGGHHCVPNESVEMWRCPPSPLLMAFGDGHDPYSYVPLDVVAGYIDSLESLGDNHDYN